MWFKQIWAGLFILFCPVGPEPGKHCGVREEEIRSKSRSAFRIGRWPPSGKPTLEECCWSRSGELANLHGANLLTKNPNRSGLRPMMIAANTLGTYSRVSGGSARAR